LIEIKDSFASHPLSHFMNRITAENETLLGTYNKGFDYLSLSHPLYSRNWRVNFLDKHRFMNWILYTFLKNARTGSDDIMFSSDILAGDFTVMDIGCYDSCLVGALSNNGIRTYGYDDNDWSDMYNLLGTTSRVNSESKKEDIDVAIVLNYAHMFPPDELANFVEKKCGNMPSLIFFDFDTSIYHEHHRLYENTRAEYTTVGFAASAERELYIWEG